MSTTIREILRDEIRKEVFGPYESDETFQFGDSPKSRYISGVLYPIQTPMDDEDVQNHHTASKDNESNETDEKIPINVGTKPSSMGLTCNVSTNQKKVIATISYARYCPSTSNKKDETSQENNDNDEDKYPDWKRVPISPDPITINLGKKSHKHPLDDNIFFRYIINENKKYNYFSLSVFVTNESITKGDNYVNDTKCIFQPQIKLTSSDSSKVFLNISWIHPEKIEKLNPDEKTTEFLFRDFKHFAIGRNCSVEWEEPKESDNTTGWVQTTFTPHYRIPEIKPRKPSDDMKKSLSMKNLYEISDCKEYSEILKPLKDGYRQWIDDLIKRRNGWEKSTSDYEKNFIAPSDDIPQNQIKNCEDAYKRIEKGIEIISSHPLVGEAFRFANEAMYLNLSHSEWSKRNRDKLAKGEQITEDGPNFDSQNPPEWRLFQLAFLILNIESIVNPTSPDRKSADLLWFPTGGGKTEAYYGIIAFTLAYRRLKGSYLNKQRTNPPKLEEQLDRYGISVIMRYTYRLLTLQQFQRAATLFCAFEYIRLKNSKNKEKFGDEPFLVGLWVGRDTTPNSFDDAKKTIERKRRHPELIIDKTDPIQLLNCPWCGRKLDAFKYEFDDNYQSLEKLRPNRIRIRCHNNCFFGKPKDSERVLPVVFVDEDIRNHRPSLLISTVDKFAQISWNWQYASLFGIVSQYCKEHGYNPGNSPSNSDKLCNHKKKKRTFQNGEEAFIPVAEITRKLAPPELIIQDELHLIAGPLGTLTGLYETAIDILCTDSNGIKPKIIASTATTKKSDFQIKELFNVKTTNIFPPQGFEFGDSYFAEVLPITSENPGKLHVGVCSTSVSGYNVDSRISSCIIRKIRHIQENKDKFNLNGKNHTFSNDEVDSYFTLVSYYNTIKSLGSAMRMFEDRVPHYMDAIMNITEEKFQKTNNAKKQSTKNLNKKELTGRISAADIPKILEKVETKIPDQEALDALLCTNMLSVGVDVDRLNVMVINGQPKSTSEYIQASGRIGRQFPGIVITNYTYIRPRDLSYFENFNQFHSTYYKSVEPGTLTPFAERARDRGLAGVFFALVRLCSKTTSDDPKRFSKNDRVDEITAKILDRVKNLDPKEEESTSNDIKKIIEKWETIIEHYRDWSSESTSDLKYRRNPFTNESKSGITYLLNSSRDVFDDRTFVIPESLREAESEIRLYYSKYYGENK